MGRLEGILFDLDGVLVDAADWHKDAFNQTLKEFCLEPLKEKDHEENFNGLSTRAKLAILRSRNDIPDDWTWSDEAFYDRKQEITMQIIEARCSGVPRILDAVDYAHYYTGGKIGVVTNCSPISARFMLEKSQLLDTFPVIITNADVDGKIKPHPRPYIEGMDALGLMNRIKRNTLAIDDTEKGIKSALEAGCITWRLKKFDDLSVLNLSAFVRNLEKGL